MAVKRVGLVLMLHKKDNDRGVTSIPLCPSPIQRSLGVKHSPSLLEPRVHIDGDWGGTRVGRTLEWVCVTWEFLFFYLFIYLFTVIVDIVGHFLFTGNYTHVVLKGSNWRSFQPKTTKNLIGLELFEIKFFF